MLSAVYVMIKVDLRFVLLEYCRMLFIFRTSCCSLLGILSLVVRVRVSSIATQPFIRSIQKMCYETRSGEEIFSTLSLFLFLTLKLSPLTSSSIPVR